MKRLACHIVMLMIGFGVAAADANLPPFFDALQKDGSWILLAESAWVWQPTAMQLDANWRPYVHAGSWTWNEENWFWTSEYAWGTIAFHYGRWFRDSRYGWVWVPGLQWSPAWVDWRLTDTHCGWAPMPPDDDFLAACGLEGPMLTSQDYLFVPHAVFLAKDVAGFIEDGRLHYDHSRASISGPERFQTTRVESPATVVTRTTEVETYPLMYYETTSPLTIRYYTDPWPWWSSSIHHRRPRYRPGPYRHAPFHAPRREAPRHTPPAPRPAPPPPPRVQPHPQPPRAAPASGFVPEPPAIQPPVKLPFPKPGSGFVPEPTRIQTPPKAPYPVPPPEFVPEPTRIQIPPKLPGPPAPARIQPPAPRPAPSRPAPAPIRIQPPAPRPVPSRPAPAPIRIQPPAPRPAPSRPAPAPTRIQPPGPRPAPSRPAPAPIRIQPPAPRAAPSKSPFPAPSPRLNPSSVRPPSRPLPQKPGSLAGPRSPQPSPRAAGKLAKQR